MPGPPITNPQRRRAVLLCFLPLLAIPIILTFHFKSYLAPTMVSWPTQQQLAIEFRRMVQYRLWPWTVSDDVHARGGRKSWYGVEDLDEEEQEELDALTEALSQVEAGSKEAVFKSGESPSSPPVKPVTRRKRMPFRRHIVAVGDLHGDLPNARKVLQFSGVTDAMGNWTGEVDIFAQTGDIIDRGDDTIHLFVWMDKLRAQATKAGGHVMSHLGNHEWMNAIGDWRYVYPTEIRTFGSIAARQKMITTGRIGRSWARNYTTAGRLPLHPSLGAPNTPWPPASPSFHLWGVRFGPDHDISSHSHLPVDRYTDRHGKTVPVYEGLDPYGAVSFVHGGLSPSYSNLSPFPTKINTIAESLLKKLQSRPQPPPHPPAPYPGLPADTTPEEQELYGANGPLWYRGWALEDELSVCSHVDAVLKKTGTRRMIMGHTPDFANIKSRCGGKVIIIDTGISHAYGGVLSALSIHYSVEPIPGRDDLWKEREVVSAVYAQRREIISDEEKVFRSVGVNFGAFHRGA